MPRRESAHQEEEPENAERWLLTYADLITLLLGLFILLYSMSQQDMAKFKSFSQGLRTLFGGGGKGYGSAIGAPIALDPMVIGNKPTPIGSPGRGGSAQEVAKEIEKTIERLNAQSQVTVSQTGKGIHITIADELGRPPFAFESGSSRLNPRMVIVLNAIADLLQDTASQVRIEGHTDDVPISTDEFPSNWELSSSRAVRVLRYLISRGCDPERLAASGYAEYKPVAGNTTPEGRARNRRVEIYIQYGRYGGTESVSGTAGESSEQPR